jgi:hypothetical protein
VPSTTDAIVVTINEAMTGLAAEQATQGNHWDIVNEFTEPPLIVHVAAESTVAETTKETEMIPAAPPTADASVVTVADAMVVAEATSETIVADANEVVTIADAMVIADAIETTVAEAAEEEVADAIEEGEVVEATEILQPPTTAPSDPPNESQTAPIDVGEPGAAEAVVRDLTHPYSRPEHRTLIPPDDHPGWEWMMSIELDNDECDPGMRWRARYGRDEGKSRWRRQVPVDEDTVIDDYDDYFHETSEEDSEEEAQRRKKAAKRRQQRQNKAARKRRR